jgi:hypothetical protein
MVEIIAKASQFFYDQVINKGLTVSTQQVQPLKQLEVYPNPSQGGLVYLSVDAEQPYLLFDITGRQLRSGRLSEGQNTLSLEGLQRGMYILRTPDAVARVLVP